jgi:hypothetical protein
VGRVAALDGMAIVTGRDGRMRALGNLEELWARTFGDRGSLIGYRALKLAARLRRRQPRAPALCRA